MRLRNNNTGIGLLLSGRRLFQHNPLIPDLPASRRSERFSTVASRPVSRQRAASGGVGPQQRLRFREPVP